MLIVKLIRLGLFVLSLSSQNVCVISHIRYDELETDVEWAYTTETKPSLNISKYKCTTREVARRSELMCPCVISCVKPRTIYLH